MEFGGDGETAKSGSIYDALPVWILYLGGSLLYLVVSLVSFTVFESKQWGDFF